MPVLNKLGCMLLFALSVQTYALSIHYDFEDADTSDWSSDNNVAGPWLANEWSVSGGASVKADVNLGSEKKYTLKLTQNVDYSNAEYIETWVHTSEWGYFAEGSSAKIYIKTGDDWIWHSSESVVIDQEGGSTKLFLDLSAVDNLSYVREIGVEFFSASGSDGFGSIYVDDFLVRLGGLAENPPQWTVPTSYARFDGEGNVYIRNNGGAEKFDFHTGEMVWRYEYQSSKTKSFDFDENDAMYIVDNNHLKKVDKNNLSTFWEFPVENDYITPVYEFNDRFYFKAKNKFIAINRSQGKEEWRYTMESYYTRVHFINPELVIFYENDTITAVNTSDAKVVWQYYSDGHAHININEREHIFLRNGENHNILRQIDSKTGQELWHHYSGSHFVDNPYLEGDDVIYYLSGAQDAKVLKALNYHTGEVIWKTAARENFQPWYINETQMILWGRDDVMGIDTSNGNITWRYDNASPSLNRLDDLYITVADGETTNLNKVDPDTGAIIWQRKYATTSTISPITLYDGNIILKLPQSYMKVDKETGETHWEFFTGKKDRSVYLSEKFIYINHTSNIIAAVDLKDGKRKFFSKLSAPVNFRHQHNDVVFFQYKSTQDQPYPHGAVAIGEGLF